MSPTYGLISCIIYVAFVLCRRLCVCISEYFFYLIEFCFPSGVGKKREGAFCIYLSSYFKKKKIMKPNNGSANSFRLVFYFILGSTINS